MHKETHGIWRIIPSIPLTEIIGQSGFDFQILDCEHGAYDFHTLSQNITACHAQGCLAYVRVSELNKVETIGFLTVLLNSQSGQAFNVGNPTEEHSLIELPEIMISLGLSNSKIKLLAENNNNSYLKSPIARNTPAVDKMATLGWGHQQVQQKVLKER